MVFFFSSRRRHTRFKCDWSSDVCSSDLLTNWFAAAVERDKPTRYGNAKASQRGLPSRASNCFSFYLRTQGVILGIDAVELQKIRVQASCMVAYIADAEDKTSSKWVLDFMSRVLHHTGTPSTWRP